MKIYCLDDLTNVLPRSLPVPPLVQNSRVPRPAFISHRPALLNSALPLSDSALPLSTAPLCHPPIEDQVTSRKCPSWRYITQSDRNVLFLIRGPAPRPPSPVTLMPPMLALVPLPLTSVQNVPHSGHMLPCPSEILGEALLDVIYCHSFFL